MPERRDKRLALIAGEGLLPVSVAKNAASQGFTPIVLSVGRDNHAPLKALSHIDGFYTIVPGLFEQTLTLLRREQITHLVFAGKVNKWMLLRNPKLDALALGTLKKLRFRNDDRMMRGIIDALKQAGIDVLHQTQFLQEHLIGPGTLSNRPPTEAETVDITYGLTLAREMGRLDVGQTVVVHKGMVLAVEAIEGTDECLKRAGHWAAKQGGVVAKAAKPNQDQRFDVPTVGIKTLKQMKKAGLRVLATEAHATLYLEIDAMRAFADQHEMTIISLEPSAAALPTELREGIDDSP